MRAYALRTFSEWSRAMTPANTTIDLELTELTDAELARHGRNAERGCHLETERSAADTDPRYTL